MGKLIFEETPLKGAYVVTPSLQSDDRGAFSRIFCKEEYSRIGHLKDFVQINHSFNATKGTLRGLHYQKSPHQETKLIRCTKGSVYDVIVDLRENSSTYMKHFSIILTAKNMKMIYIPEYFAHGFQTLENETELIYHHTSPYHHDSECGLSFEDPTLNISWPLRITKISEKDKSYSMIQKSAL